MKPWTYVQKTGKLFDPSGALASTGYAGRGEGLNNPAMQQVHMVGPLPVGLYSAGTPQNGTRLGPDAIPLVPFGSNTMFGRGGFYCHADNAHLDHSASEGCIVMDTATRARLVPGTVIEVVSFPAVAV